MSSEMIMKILEGSQKMEKERKWPKLKKTYC